jgi:hypothetical protein
VHRRIYARPFFLRLAASDSAALCKAANQCRPNQLPATNNKCIRGGAQHHGVRDPAEYVFSTYSKYFRILEDIRGAWTAARVYSYCKVLKRRLGVLHRVGWG